MILKDLITELQKIADQGEEWKNAPVERCGTIEENEKNGGPSEIDNIQACDFGDHNLVVLITTGDPSCRQS